LQTEWTWLGSVSYAKALLLQEQVRSQVVEERGPETLLLLEHEPVITLGRSADLGNVVASPEHLRVRGISVEKTSRGGDVTYHGPGQVVGYPVFRLRRGVRAHVRAMAAGIIDVLADLGIAGEWRDSHPGVWVGAEKICAFGVHVRHRVAIHGFALNGSIDLAGFRAIVPCGLRALGVTSIARLRGFSPRPEVIADNVSRAFEKSFGTRMVRISASSSRLQIANGNL
jgi:lipoyl(octanoyl) transferase